MKILKGKPSAMSALLLEALRDQAESHKKKSAKTRRADWTEFARNSTLNGGKAAHKFMNDLEATPDTLLVDGLPLAGAAALQTILQQWLARWQDPKRKKNPATWDVGGDTFDPITIARLDKALASFAPGRGLGVDNWTPGFSHAPLPRSWPFGPKSAGKKPEFGKANTPSRLIGAQQSSHVKRRVGSTTCYVHGPAPKASACLA